MDLGSPCCVPPPATILIHAEVGFEIENVLLKDVVEAYGLPANISRPVKSAAVPPQGGNDAQAAPRPAEGIPTGNLVLKAGIDQLLEALPTPEQLPEMTEQLRACPRA